MRPLFSFIDRLTDAGAWLAALALGVIVTSFWLEVVSRYFLNAPTSWTASVSLYLMLTMVMLMIPWLTREGQHVTMTLVFERAPTRLALPIARFISVLSCVICLVAAYFCVIETIRQYEGEVRSPDALLLPMWWLSSFLVYGFAMSALHFARHVVTGFMPRHGEA